MTKSPYRFLFLCPESPSIGWMRLLAERGGLAVVPPSLLPASPLDLPDHGILQDAECGTAGISLAMRSTTRLCILSADLLGPLAGEVADRVRRASRHPSFRLLVEVSDSVQLPAALEAGADAVVARGEECGGWGGESTSFTLLQALAASCPVPFYARGGLSPHTVAAAARAGAAGCVFGPESWGLTNAPWSADVRSFLAGAEHAEAIRLWEESGETITLRIPRGSDVEGPLRSLEKRSFGEPLWKRLRRLVRILDRHGLDPSRLLAGSDALLAESWTRSAVDAVGMLNRVRRAFETPVDSLVRDLVGPESPLATSHGTATPFVQGPMTRVTDSPDFAARVAEAGALPTLALALMRPSAVREVLEAAAAGIGDRPWGVGMLGFIDPELFEGQVREVKRAAPPFALIAGGRPEQVGDLEDAGIPSYVHAPSPGIQTLLLEGGVRRLVWEGRECGGHIGPESSFTLWSRLTDALLARVNTVDLREVHVLLAGGLHDGLSVAMAAAASAPLVRAGCKVGFLMGTAYLYTREIVETGALCVDYQQRALNGGRTRLMRTSPGHVIRCLPSPFVDRFEQTKRELRERGLGESETHRRLEEMNIGRLRIAAKGIAREGDALRDVEEAARWREGVYMIGQVACLQRRVRSLAELHRDILDGAEARLAAPEPPSVADTGDIAIIGMEGLFPGADGAEELWQRILDECDLITEVPADRWDWREWFDTDRRSPDKLYGKWGGFLHPRRFEPGVFGMPPSSLASIEPLQLLTLLVARRVMDRCGLLENPELRERTSVILGITGGLAELGQRYVLRTGARGPGGEGENALPEWTEDSFAGTLMNVTAGRIANRLDLGGGNYTVDAACASSLTAVYLACQELRAGTADAVLTGGADTFQSPFNYMCFAKTRALSARGRCRTFDRDADGTCIGEGIGLLLLKRMEDARRDGDAVLGVIRGVAGSSDGRAKGLTAPHPRGQMRCLENAYKAAGVDPVSVGLVEAHGTGTTAGDRCEIEALCRVFSAHGATASSVALGSVKSNIGHTKGAAGVAGILKAVEAMRREVLPATLHVEHPNPALADGPFFANTRTRPWLAPIDGGPRRAGVSGFGFGGANFHVVLEAPAAELSGSPPAASAAWPSELILLSAATPEELRIRADRLARGIETSPDVSLADLARGCWREQPQTPGPFRFAYRASSRADVLKALRSCAASEEDREGVRGRIPDLPPRLAFLFPGQGAQYPGMLMEAAVHFPELRRRLEEADRALDGRWEHPLSRYIFPPVDGGGVDVDALAQTDRAQAALGAVALGLLDLLAGLGVAPAATAGHSYGEFTALVAAGAISAHELPALSADRGRYILEEAGSEGLGRMLAVMAGEPEVTAAICGMDSVWIANLNGPNQTILSATEAALPGVKERLETAGMTCVPVSVHCGFHSPLVAPARDRLKNRLDTLVLRPPSIPVYGNTLARPYPADADAIRDLLGDHLVSPVLFERQVRSMAADGIDWFVEIGPRRILGNLCRGILEKGAARVFPLDLKDTPFTDGLQEFLAAAWMHGLPVHLDRLTAGRSRVDSIDEALSRGRPQPPTPACWEVSGGAAHPLGESHSPPVWPKPLSHVPPPDPVMTPPPTPCPGDSSGDSLLAEHQRLMSRFLETHRQVMLSALGTASAPEPETALPLAPGSLSISDVGPATTPESPAGKPPEPAGEESAGSRAEERRETLFRVVEESTGYPADMLDPELDLESEMGIDSIKRVEIVGRVRKRIEGLRDAPPPSASRTLGQLLDWMEDSLSLREEAFQTSAPVPAADTLRDRVLGIVSERTGYPPEMMNTAANLESEMGIDSIKRVEIAGMIRKTFPDHPALADSESARKLSGCSTLDDMFALLEAPPVEAASGDAPAAHDTASIPMETSAEAPAKPRDDSNEPPARFRMVPLPLPARAPERPLPEDGGFLLTGTEGSVLEALASRLRSEGARVEILPFTESSRDPDAACREARGRLGTVRAWVHAEAPVAFRMEEADGEAMERAVRNGPVRVARTARLLFGDLAEGGRVLVSLPGVDDRHPAQGALTGFVNTLAVEWTEASCRSVEWAATLEPEAKAEALFRELRTRDRHPQVLLDGTDRYAPHAEPAPFRPEDSRTPLEAGDVVWLTGGGRGITAEISRTLARKRGCTLFLGGRSPEPAAEEPEETRGRETAADLRAHFIASGAYSTPGEIERAVKACLRDREIRSTLRTIRDTGCVCEYLQGDVADGETVRRHLDLILERTGRLDVVVHGAGVIEDRLVSEKDPESVVRVFRPKTTGAVELARQLARTPVRDVVLFSSVATYGNRGQADYAAANMALHDLAHHWNLRGGPRCRAVLWGPWEGGMADEEAQRGFRERGVQVISPPAGSDWLLEELEHPRKACTPVVAGNGPWFRPDRARSGWRRPSALLDADDLRPLRDGSREALIELDPERHPYLRDHVLDGTPVLPAAMAMELMAGAAACTNPGWTPEEIRDVHVLRGVVLQDGRPVKLRVRLRTSQPEHPADFQLHLQVELADPDHPNRLLYRSRVVLARTLPPPPAEGAEWPEDLVPLSKTVKEAYRDWLFHGECFAGIREVRGVSDGAIAARMETLPPERLLVRPGASAWTVDPVLVDSAFQLSILWERWKFDMTPLPTRCDVVKRYGPPVPGPVECLMRTRPGAEGVELETDIFFRDAGGSRFLELRGMRFTCSAELNRLAGEAMRKEGVE